MVAKNGLAAQIGLAAQNVRVDIPTPYIYDPIGPCGV